MKEEHSIFKNWIPRSWTIVLLILCMFPHLAVLTMFNMNSTFTASFLDVNVDDLQFMLAITYAMLVCGLFVHIRIFHYFNTRTYLVVMTVLNILVLIIMTLTTNQHLIYLLRFIQGPISILEGIILLPILIGQIKGNHARYIAYCCLYCYMLTGDKFTTSLVKFAIQNYSHNMIMYVMMAVHVITLLIYVLSLNHNRFFPRKPLNQINVGGLFIMAIALISGAFALIYGKRLYWFESQYIVLSIALFLIFSGLFVFHQRTSKRPLFYFQILRSERVILGIILFFFMYLMRSSMGNVYQVMGQVWDWHWEYVLDIQYFNVFGSIAGIIFSYYLHVKKVDYRYVFMLGFFIMASSMYYFSYCMYPDTKLWTIAPGIFAEGFGQGLLFTPIVIFMYGSVHVSVTASALQSGTAIRYWTTIIGFSVMQNATLYLTTKHQFLMNENLAITSPFFQDEWSSLMQKYGANHLHNEAVQLSSMAIQSRLYKQALLVSNMELFTALAIIGLVVFFGILLYRPIKTSLGFRTKPTNPTIK